jgi:hydrogenase-1 operon protein HyaF
MSREAHSGRLASIRVAVESESGNVPLLMHELRHALEALVADGTTHVVDLRAIPLAPGEEDRLLEALGRGELVAEFHAHGKSEICECGYPGVWRVTHWNAIGELVGRFIEVTYAPALLASQPQDVRAGLARLTNLLQDGASAAGAMRA